MATVVVFVAMCCWLGNGSGWNFMAIVGGLHSREGSCFAGIPLQFQLGCKTTFLLTMMKKVGTKL